MTTPVPGAVFDCVVLLQAAISRKGPSFACKELLDAGKVTVFLSPEVLAEITDVLHRPELQKKFKALTPARAEAFLRDLTGKARAITEILHTFSHPRDPEDERYVNLALVAGARYLVTWDNDLLDLMADNPEGTAFRGRFPGLVILTPVAFLREQRQIPAAPSDAHESGTS
jgi:putative PIN family toxin of toxin-antitoxin system